MPGRLGRIEICDQITDPAGVAKIQAKSSRYRVEFVIEVQSGRVEEKQITPHGIPAGQRDGQLTE